MKKRKRNAQDKDLNHKSRKNLENKSALTTDQEAETRKKRKKIINKNMKKGEEGIRLQPVMKKAMFLMILSKYKNWLK